MKLPLSAQNLTVDYGHGPVVHRLSFTLPQPTLLAVVGHNGSGKSTLLRALANRVPFRGTVTVAGRPHRPGVNPAATGLLAYLEQKNTVGFSLPVRELVVMGRFARKRWFEAYNAADYASADAALAALTIEHLAERDFTELSGGEQQLVWLAQVATQEAPLCLLDEPTQQLDLYHKKKVFDQLLNWVDHGRTVVCVTHDVGQLRHRTGWLLNASMPHPTPEVLTPETLDRHVAWLERAPPYSANSNEIGPVSTPAS